MSDLSVSEKKMFPSIPVLFLLLGYLTLGAAFMAFLPPWEGFDETAHYSYIQQVSDTKTLPRIGGAFISEDVDNYAGFAPVAYSSVPPFENNRGFNYRSFFESSDKIIHDGTVHVHHRPEHPRKYTPGKTANWQAQHPPLYYILLSPVYRLTSHLSWSNQVFILRMCSYLLAWFALIVAISSSLVMIRLESIKDNRMLQYWIIFGTAIIPVLFPSWFPEMGRMGNDSLCALIMSLVWYVLLHAYQHGLKWTHSIIIGVLLGLGCLTKVFFVLVSAGVFFFWVFRQWKLQGKKCLPRLPTNLAIMLFLILCLSGWWYYKNWHEYGILSGADEMITLAGQGGLFAGLKKHFSMFSWMRGHAAFVTTLGWCCTWSLARPHYIFLAPLALLVLWTAAAYAYSLKGHSISHVSWIPLWLIVPVVIGFSYHVLVRIALMGEGTGIGGYYLLFMAAPLGVAIGLGYGNLWSKTVFRILTLVLIVYAIVFTVIISWEQMMMFAGILFKAGSNKFYQFPDRLPHLLGIPEAFSRLKAIAFPNVGIILWLAGETLIIIGLISGFNSAYLIRKEILSEKNEIALKF